MISRFALLWSLFLTPLATSGSAVEAAPEEPVAIVRELLETPEYSIDFAQAKLAIDASIDPATDAGAIRAELDAMVATVERMLATIPPEKAGTNREKLAALRAFLYEPGWWNDHRPFQYDFSDAYGQNLGAQLLSTYLRSRRGNCVSMPILFAILGDRLGLDVTLSTAPLHVFVKYTDDSGTTWNLEATSGAGFTRDVWYRERLPPITDEAITNGVYLKTLTRREAVSVMAATLLEYLLAQRRYAEAIAVADVLIEVYPANAHALVKKGTAYARLLNENFIRKYPRESDIPADELPYAVELYQANQEAFARAEALGWREPELTGLEPRTD